MPDIVPKSRNNHPPTVDLAVFSFVSQKERINCQWLSYYSHSFIFESWVRWFLARAMLVHSLNIVSCFEKGQRADDLTLCILLSRRRKDRSTRSRSQVLPRFRSWLAATIEEEANTKVRLASTKGSRGVEGLLLTFSYHPKYRVPNGGFLLFGYRVGTPLAGGSTGLRWSWFNYLAGVWN